MTVPALSSTDPHARVWFHGRLISVEFPNINQGLACVGPTSPDMQLRIGAAAPVSVGKWYVRLSTLFVESPTVIPQGSTAQLIIPPAAIRDSGGGGEESDPNRDYPGGTIDLDVRTGDTTLAPEAPPENAHAMKLGQMPDFCTYFTPGWQFTDLARHGSLTNWTGDSDENRQKTWQVDGGATSVVVDPDSGLPSAVVGGGYARTNVMSPGTVRAYPHGEYVARWRGDGNVSLQITSSQGTVVPPPVQPQPQMSPDGYKYQAFTITGAQSGVRNADRRAAR